jgi:dihydroorotase
MHEGYTSENRGLSGIPKAAEHVAVSRTLLIAEYATGKVHLASLSTPESAEMVFQARAKNLQASCSVAAHQLAFTDENLDKFATVHKVWPPYCGETDRLELVQAVNNGKIDAIVSAHTPLHYDFKDVEFEVADFGISSLETTFSTLVTYARISKPEVVVELLSNGPRKILDLPNPKLEVGTPANFTLFSMDKTWTPLPDKWQSKSRNNPFFNKTLTGCVFGIVTENGFSQNPHFS